MVFKLGAYGETLCSYIARATYGGTNQYHKVLPGCNENGSGNSAGPVHNSEIPIHTTLKAVEIRWGPSLGQANSPSGIEELHRQERQPCVKSRAS